MKWFPNPANRGTILHFEQEASSSSYHAGCLAACCDTQPSTDNPTPSTERASQFLQDENTSRPRSNQCGESVLYQQFNKRLLLQQMGSLTPSFISLSGGGLPLSAIRIERLASFGPAVVTNRKNDEAEGW